MLIPGLAQRRLPSSALLLFAPFLLSACDALMGKEVARLPVNALSAPGRDVVRATTVQLQQGDKVALWSEMDVGYQGEAQLEFQVQLLQNGQPVQRLAFDPREKDISLKEVKTSVNGDVNWSFTGRNASFVVPATGAYTLKARLVAIPHATVQLRKAELVLRR
ncbi:hypothetical protein EJV47_22810 [Hymenobacter gummosus]|uniref:Uncharacterized protein n=1 Tax=Hymenobacter gummosus TaxID=1776032 RepID=A0A3S0K1U3_9BACT|nr:hypothetical protein [Hymenobacter gummosus]RTQ45993.1 hypothetical protein EJV47_22810 [Hymenobacter gummosus]